MNRKNKWKTENGYFTVPKEGKTFKEISNILSEEEGKNVPQSTVSNIFRRGLIKIANHIASEYEKDIDVEMVCRNPNFRSSLMDVMTVLNEKKEDDSSIPI
tara:strand:+ start:1761 stop:2063 length:303 start_codon:yes stop_codon:yes gene_type:complete